MKKRDDDLSESVTSSSVTDDSTSASDDDDYSSSDSQSITSESTSQMYTSSSDLDSEEAAANEKAKKGGVSDDPFKKRVPSSFYEKEKKKFSPLPKNWEVGQSGKKFFYVDHSTKTTTWVDPRTKSTRTHDIMKCKMGELPFGWEEDIDADIGVYYIDHNTQSTYLDPPWDPRIQFQVRALQSFLADQIEMYKQKIAEMNTASEILEKEKESEVGALNDEKARLQREIDELRRKAAESSDDDYTTETEDEEEVKVPATLEEFQQRLKDLMRLQGMLQPAAGTDEVSEYKKTQEEIDKVQHLLDQEEEARRKILEEMERLKNQLNDNMAVPEDTFVVPQEEPLLRPVEDAEHIASMPARKAQLTRRTRYEMQMELLLLKKRLEAEKIQNQALASLQGKATDREGALPMWIRKMNDIASSSKTLRMKIVMKQKSGGEQLSFRERMLFFTTNIVENKTNNGGPTFIPPPPRKLN